VGLILGVPLYYFLGEDGIIPSMIVVSLSSMGFSWWLVSKIDYQQLKISVKETIKGSKEMMKLGIALTYLAFLGLLSDYLIRAFIAEFGSLEQVGIFQAGVVLITSYFGIILTALNTDYYPRMFAVAHDNNELKKQMNMQVNTAFLMLTPTLCFFIIFMPLIINILYTNKFLEATNYLQFAIFGLLINVYADSLDVVLIAKQKSKLVAILVSIYRIVSIPLLFLGYYISGLQGLGVAAILSPLVNLILIGSIVYKKFNVFYTQSTNINIFILIIFLTITTLVSLVENPFAKYISSSLTFTSLVFYSNYQLKRMMNIDLISYAKLKLKFKR
ncbi:MAG: oligosaccharide flippase family protein, partial [Desulfuromonadaceae bacterium]|nr:oligosaccharide flippase family protein [Desulfuromonadaceae bacterium]